MANRHLQMTRAIKLRQVPNPFSLGLQNQAKRPHASMVYLS
jgi:hypothetical protein